MSRSVAAPVAAVWALWALWCLAPWRVPARRPAGSVASQRARTMRRLVRSPRARTASGAGLALGAVALGAPSVGVLAFVVVTVVPVARRSAERRRTARAAAACVPDVGELLRIGVAAGLTPVLAVERLAQLAPGPGRAAARAVLHATRRGRPLADALPLLVEHLGTGVRPLVDALTATERYGVPLDAALDAAVADLRRQRRTEAAAAARRLPVSLSFPLVGCVLPAFALLTLAPLVAGAFGSLRAGPSPSAGVGADAGTSLLGPTGPRPFVPAGGPDDAPFTRSPTTPAPAAGGDAPTGAAATAADAP